MIANPAILPPDFQSQPAAPPRAHPHPHPHPHPQPDPLSLLLSSSLPIADLAASLGLSLPDFLTLYQSPDFQSQLAAIDDLTQTRLRIHSAQARLTAIQTLESLTKSAQDPVERRRAAAGLMRATSTATQRTHAGDDDESDFSRARPRPRPRQLPSRRLRAEQVAALIARALADNDAPTPDSGLATLHAFLSTDTRAASPHLPDFIAAAHDQAEDPGDDQVEHQADGPARASADLPLPDLAALADLLEAPDEATCSPAVEHGRTAQVDVRVGAETPTIRVQLTRPDTGPRRMCWLIDRIARRAPATGPPDE